MSALTKLVLFQALAVLICLHPSGRGPALSQEGKSSRAVTAAQINGVYRYHRNEFRVLALGKQKLKVQFYGEWMTRAGYPHIGEARGEANIEGSVAVFIPGITPRCKITMTFIPPNRMDVVQEGADSECDFGQNVMATGTYRRVKAGKPKFIPIPH
ncbi:MAG: hypothetical protein ACXW18_11360 [Pyrinomonadaceae bacterium]